MATPRLQNAFIKPAYQAMVRQRILKKSAIFNSAAVLRTAEYDALAAGTGTQAIMPWLAPLDGNVDIGALDASIRGAVDPLKMGTMVSQKDFLAKSWGISNLDARLAGVEDVLVLPTAADWTADYWTRVMEDLLVAKLTGVVADNVANDGGDLVVNVANDATGTVADAQKFSANAFIDAMLTMGDAFDDLALVVMPVQVYGTALKQDGINFIQPSAVQPFRTYRGVPVIVSDNSNLYTSGTNRKTFNTYFMGRDSILFGSAEGIQGDNVIETDEHAANNMGAKDLITRQHLYLHIAGHSSNAPVVAGYGSPTFDAYKQASAWDRVANERKQIKLAVLKSNG